MAREHTPAASDTIRRLRLMELTMIRKYDAETRGRTKLDWLDGRHSFSFRNWCDPERMAFRALRVLNDDVIAGRLRLVATQDGRDGPVTIHQDAEIRIGRLAGGNHVVHPVAVERHVYVHAALGEVVVSGVPLEEGAGVGISDETEVRIEADADAEVLLFDLA